MLKEFSLLTGSGGSRLQLLLAQCVERKAPGHTGWTGLEVAVLDSRMIGGLAGSLP